LQIVPPPPPVDRDAVARHLHRDPCQASVFISQLAVCERIYRWAHRLSHGESITSIHHKPPYLANSAYIILYGRCGVNGISVPFRRVAIIYPHGAADLTPSHWTIDVTHEASDFLATTELDLWLRFQNEPTFSARRGDWDLISGLLAVIMLTL
jgi:hypothetical protein